MNKEELLNLIKKGMVCDEEFLKKVYGKVTERKIW